MQLPKAEPAMAKLWCWGEMKACGCGVQAQRVPVGILGCVALGARFYIRTE